jgi:hypothetical protein
MPKYMNYFLTWIAGGAIGLIATIALATTSTTSSNIATLQSTVATHSTEISNLKLSSCVQNANMRNLAVALKTSFVNDPSCN